MKKSRPTARPYSVEFGGETHGLLFNYAARWAFEEKFKRPFLAALGPVLQAIVDRLKAGGSVDPKDLGEAFGLELALTLVEKIYFRDLCGLVWAGLQHEAPAPSLEDVGELLEDEQPALVLMHVMQAYRGTEPRAEDLPPAPAAGSEQAKAAAENPTVETQAATAG